MPYAIWVRTVSRHASGPVQLSTPTGNVTLWGYPGIGYRPVDRMAGPATSIRGPGTMPSRAASRRPTSRYPAPSVPRSRIVVNPCASAMDIACTALAARWPGFSSIICRARSSSSRVLRSSTCVCASMKPGSRLAPGRWITGQPSGASPVTPAIASPSMSTVVPAAHRPARASNTRAPDTARREPTAGATGIAATPQPSAAVSSTATRTAGTSADTDLAAVRRAACC